AHAWRRRGARLRDADGAEEYGGDCSLETAAARPWKAGRYAALGERSLRGPWRAAAVPPWKAGCFAALGCGRPQRHDLHADCVCGTSDDSALSIHLEPPVRCPAWSHSDNPGLTSHRQRGKQHVSKVAQRPLSKAAEPPLSKGCVAARCP